MNTKKNLHHYSICILMLHISDRWIKTFQGEKSLSFKLLKQLLASG